MSLFKRLLKGNLKLKKTPKQKGDDDDSVKYYPEDSLAIDERLLIILEKTVENSYTAWTLKKLTKLSIISYSRITGMKKMCFVSMRCSPKSLMGII